ncbi:MAG: leucine-rich repeat domain-containing protein, partial [Clostridia bacterium]|nr:leucine-rich repeat domain-containing protein [Clostridia bacterium]
VTLKKVFIHNGVKSIGNSAFRGCTGLTSIEIPNSVTSIGGYAFYNCSNLTDIYCEAEIRPSGWDSEWLIGCNATVHWGYKG